ncbi:hypothetical protein N332_02422, partial [Mesitornis unicolor]
AAIDFLLLAQGHGCQDYEGMCCFNLSDHFSSIHQQLAVLQQNMERISVSSDPFLEWLSNL